MALGTVFVAPSPPTLAYPGPTGQRKQREPLSAGQHGKIMAYNSAAGQNPCPRSQGTTLIGQFLFPLALGIQLDPGSTRELNHISSCHTWLDARSRRPTGRALTPGTPEPTVSAEGTLLGVAGNMRSSHPALQIYFRDPSAQQTQRAVRS
jgi:hypothetical protein